MTKQLVPSVSIKVINLCRSVWERTPKLKTQIVNAMKQSKMVKSLKLHVLVGPTLNANQNARNSSLPKIFPDAVVISENVDALGKPQVTCNVTNGASVSNARLNPPNRKASIEPSEQIGLRNGRFCESQETPTSATMSVQIAHNVATPNDQAHRPARKPVTTKGKQPMKKPKQQPNTAAKAGSGEAPLLGDSVTYLKKGTKLTLLVESEDAAKRLYNSMGTQHRAVLRCAWGQAEPRRIDGVYPHGDWPQNTPHFVQSAGEDGTLVFRQL